MATNKADTNVNGYTITKGNKYYEVLADGIYHQFNSVADATAYIKKYFKPLV